MNWVRMRRKPVATGPLTSPHLAASVRNLTGEDQLAFFDAIAPIVHRESIDLDQAWFQSRYDKAGPGGTAGQWELRRGDRPCRTRGERRQDAERRRRGLRVA